MNINVEFDDALNAFVNVLDDGRKFILSGRSYQAALKEATWDMEEIGNIEFDEV